MSVNHVIQGFSLTNRLILYTSALLAPAQFISGLGNNCPSNIGFLAFNFYTQIAWYKAIQARQLHALSLLPFHFNTIYAFTYLGGTTSGNVYMGILLGLGTLGALALNTVSAWVSWGTKLPDGYGIYQFYFYGWRTVNHQWYNFFVVWQIGNTALSLVMGVLGLGLAIRIVGFQFNDRHYPRWWHRCVAIPCGAALLLIVMWPLILWTELIVARNHIQSDTDWIAVWLFIAQVGAMLLPPCTSVFGCFRGSKVGDETKGHEYSTKV